MLIDNIAHNRIEDGITQKLQSFVVQGFTLCIATMDTLVHQSLLVISNVVRIETQYRIKRRKKLLLLTERELQSINDIIKPHICLQRIYYRSKNASVFAFCSLNL